MGIIPKVKTQKEETNDNMKKKNVCQCHGTNGVGLRVKRRLDVLYGT